ncbi:MAG TPA: hypothetical protein VGC04_13820 [Cellulomonas sp.]
MTRVRHLVALLAFGVAFGYVEAAVVFYLRRLLDYHTGYSVVGRHVYLNLGFIAFVTPDRPVLGDEAVTSTETAREAATIVMLVAVAYLAARTVGRRLAAFFVVFAAWDLAYYAFLHVLTGWPASLADTDVYFLIPVTWVGPVATPLAIFTLVLVGGAWWYLRGREEER